jgi:predicted NBD/HSP70 family sugar kinase
MGDFNLTVILDAIRRSSGGLSRVELAQIVGLSPQTISNISRRLLDQHLIVEAGKEGSGPGKPRTILRLNPSGMYALGVHLDPAVITFVVLDLVGAVVKHSRITTPGGEPGTVIATIAAEIQQLVADSGVDEAKIAGLGVAAPGPIDLEQGTVVDPPLLSGWNRVPLRDALAEATGLSTLVDKDVTSAAVAETWAGGPSGSGSFAFMYMGTGIGCGIVLNDELVRGTSGNSGEIGHIIVDPGGPACDCGLRGCVKSSCIPQVLVDQAVKAGVLEDDPRDSSAGSAIQERFAKLVEAAGAGDRKAAEILDHSAVLVARAVSVITNTLDVERVVFGGPFWGFLSERYLNLIPQLVSDNSAARQIHDIEVVGTGVGEDVGAIGAACLVLEHTLAPRSQRLLLEG